MHYLELLLLVPLKVYICVFGKAQVLFQQRDSSVPGLEISPYVEQPATAIILSVRNVSVL